MGGQLGGKTVPLAQSIAERLMAELEGDIRALPILSVPATTEPQETGVASRAMETA